jgi:hypothetical protein
MQPSRELKFVVGGGKLLTVTAVETTETLVAGRLYRLSATAPMHIRFGASAVTAADGGFDFGLMANESVVIRAPHATLRAIEAATTTDGWLLVGAIDEGV